MFLAELAVIALGAQPVHLLYHAPRGYEFLLYLGIRHTDIFPIVL